MKNYSKFPAKKIAYSAVIAAMYSVLTIFLQPISYGVFQFRVAEALVMLPFIMPESVIGITIGCLISNCFSTFPLYDAIFGTLATLLAGLCTSHIKNRWLAGIPPVFFNALILPLMWYLVGIDEAYWISLLSITVSEFVTVFVLGVPLTILLEKKAPFLVSRKYLLEKKNKPKDDDTFVA